MKYYLLHCGYIFTVLEHVKKNFKQFALYSSNFDIFIFEEKLKKGVEKIMFVPPHDLFEPILVQSKA